MSSPYPSAPYPSGYPSATPPRSPWSSPVVLVSILAGVLLVVAGVVAAWVLVPGDDGDETEQVAATSATAEVSAPSNAVPSQDTQPSDVPPPAAAPPVDQPPPTANRSAPTVPNSSIRGFDSGYGPRCNAADDTAAAIGIYRAGSDESRVVICQVGGTGGYYYKGQRYPSGNAIEIQFPSRSGDTFVAVNGNTGYRVAPTALTITENGRVIKTEPVLFFWAD